MRFLLFTEKQTSFVIAQRPKRTQNYKVIKKCNGPFSLTLRSVDSLILINAEKITII